jgi:hypothetical protein
MPQKRKKIATQHPKRTVGSRSQMEGRFASPRACKNTRFGRRARGGVYASIARESSSTSGKKYEETVMYPRVSPNNWTSESPPRARLAYQLVPVTLPLTYLIYALALSTPPRTPSPTGPFPLT